MQKTFLKAFGGRRAREAVGNCLGTVTGSTSDGGQASSENALGTSATSAEVLKYFDSAFDSALGEDNSADDFKSFKLAFIRALNNRIEQYSNLGLGGISDLHQWTPDSSTHDAVDIALRCAVHVYGDSKDEPMASGYKFETVKTIAASTNGVVKATRCIKVTSAQPKSHFPTLIITIRGTRPGKVVDWLVNFNQDLKDTSSLIDYAKLAPHDLGLQAESQVHSGFLNGVLVLLPEILEQIRKYAAATDDPHVIFTGHSAGGAVATLAFVHVISTLGLLEGSKLRCSLITFGSPPVLSTNITPLLKQSRQHQSRKGIILAIINENDLVARLDRPYVESISQLYKTTSPRKLSSTLSATKPWPLPHPQLYHIGDLIVLKPAHKGGSPIVHGYELTPDRFSDTIFYDLEAHSRKVYQQNVNMLLAADSEPLVGLEYLRHVI